MRCPALETISKIRELSLAPILGRTTPALSVNAVSGSFCFYKLPRARRPTPEQPCRQETKLPRIPLLLQSTAFPSLVSLATFPAVETPPLLCTQPSRAVSPGPPRGAATPASQRPGRQRPKRPPTPLRLIWALCPNG